MKTLALWCAAAALPALAHATTTLPDPADASVPVPAATVPSAFDGYHPYQDRDTLSWQKLNQAVSTGSGMAGMTMPGKMGGRGAMPMPKDDGGMQ